MVWFVKVLTNMTIERRQNSSLGQAGQTLIETVVAIFILVMGVTAAVGLAIYVLNASTNITKQIIATGLAREGIEAVKNMRDSNWLKDILSTDCYSPLSQTYEANCYRSWQGGASSTVPYNINPGDTAISSQNLRLRIDFSHTNYWRPENVPGGGPNANTYGLNFDNDVNNVGFSGFYFVPQPNGIKMSSASSEYARQVIIAEDDGVSQYGSGLGNPYNKDLGPRLKITSRVWWADKKCPRVDTWPGLGKCSVQIETTLTNWKDY